MLLTLSGLTVASLLSGGVLVWILRSPGQPTTSHRRSGGSKKILAEPVGDFFIGEPPLVPGGVGVPPPPRLLSRAQATVLLVVLGLAVWGLFVDAVVTLAVLNGVVMVFFVAANGMKLALIRWSLRHPSAITVDEGAVNRIADDELPVYTVLLPLYREAAVLEQLVRGVQALDYPQERLDVKLLLEHDDIATRAAVAELSLPPCFEVLVVPDVGPVGKSRACNFGLASARGEYLVVFDAEDCPEPDQLRKSVAAFREQPPGVVCLQAKLNYFNRDHNLLTRWFTAEYSVWFDQLLPGLSHVGVVIPLGGTSNHFATERLRELEGWSVYNVTEDAELGVRIFLRGWQTAVLDSTTFEEATSRYGNWLRQRSRWVKGYMQTYLLNTQHPIRVGRGMGAKAFAAFNLFFGANTLCLLVNPIYLALLLVWYTTRAGWIASIFPAPVLYAGTVGLFVGNAACVLSAVSGCYARRNYEDVKWALLAPAYWLLMSIASYKALFQLVSKPWHWEKTDHGFLSLADQAADYTQRSTTNARTGRGAGRTVPGGRNGSSSPSTDEETAFSDGSSSPSTDEETAFSAPLAMRLWADSVALAGPTAVARETAVAAPSLGGVGAGVVPAVLPRVRRSRVLTWVTAHELAPVVAVALLAAIGASVWSYATHSMLLYGDAEAHLDVARRVTDGLDVGLAQLGSVWLPVPHLLLVPLVAVRSLWRSGIAGALVSGVCFVYSATRIYALVKELSGSRIGAWCAFALFTFNLNLLYVQSTALTEPVLIAFCVGAVYHLARWMRTFWMGELIWAAVLTGLATLSRYEAWGLLAVEVVAVVIWGHLADRRRHSKQANTLVFTLLGAYGVALWFLYNLIIFHDPLYFLHSIYSAQVINGGQAQFGLLGTKGHITTTVLTLGWDLVGTVGPPVLIAAALSIVLLGTRDPQRRRTLFVLALLGAPVLFDLVTLYAGQITIRVSQLAPHQLWNVRYGLLALPLCAVALGCIAARSRLYATAATGATVAGIALMSLSTPVTLADGRTGESHTGAGNPPLAAIYLREHYHGGEVLADDGSASSLIFESDLNLDQFISPGDRGLWQQALTTPYAHSAWVVEYPDDAIATDMSKSPRRFLGYILVAASGRARLYERLPQAGRGTLRR